jgi:arylsulfatase A-like enzyme
MLAEVLRRAGYDTRAVSANLWVSPLCGFDIGFERFHYIEPRHQLAMQAAGRHGALQWLGWARAGLRSKEDDGAAEALAVLETWSREPRERPFFWFVNLIECHAPYLPPRPWNDLGPLDRVRAGDDARTHQSFIGICKICAGRWEISDSALARMRHLYARAVAYADDWLGRLLETLEERGLLEETLVVVTSDHGENLGENRLFGHAFSLDERLTHVPLVAAGPGAPDTESAVSLADLPRMIASAAGVGDHPFRDNGLPVAEFDPLGPADHPKLQAFAREFEISPEGLERISAVLTSASDGHRKVVLRDDVELLYDLEADPLEESPLDASAADGEFEHLRAALERALRGGTCEPPSAPPAVAPDASPEELAELERQMKLLGYM